MQTQVLAKVLGRVVYNFNLNPNFLIFITKVGGHPPPHPPCYVPGYSTSHCHIMTRNGEHPLKWNMDWIFLYIIRNINNIKKSRLTYITWILHFFLYVEILQTRGRMYIHDWVMVYYNCYIDLCSKPIKLIKLKAPWSNESFIFVKRPGVLQLTTKLAISIHLFISIHLIFR